MVIFDRMIIASVSGDILGSIISIYFGGKKIGS
jgi:hypothetical protein